MVCKSNEISLCNCQRLIGIFRNLQGLFTENDLDPFILGCQLLQQLPDRGICPASIRDAKLPVRICLLFYTFCQSAQIFFRCFVSRNHDRDHWLEIKFCPSLLFQFSLCGKMPLDPFRIRDFPGGNSFHLRYCLIP